MVKTREEIMEQIRATIGDDTSDDSVSLLENVSDTLNDYESRVVGDGTDWKAEAERIDKEWRDKYIARFSGETDNNDTPPRTEPKEDKPLTYESLFETKE